MDGISRILAGSVSGGVLGAIVGVVVGIFDRGGLFILVPSGPYFWAVACGFAGGIIGALCGAVSLIFFRNRRAEDL